ncbi:MAG: YfiR family protein [Gammaproteobacteria bacterium]|nr:YfiR family protein [Gammaproteobacteria bacterium]
MSALLSALLGLSWQVSGAEPEPVGINTLKAAYLFNFARFVEWPADQQDADVNKRYFCFYRADNLARTFAEITMGAWLGQRQVMVRRLAELNDISQCDQLFTSESMPPGGGAMEGLLTVGDGVSFSVNGGVIALVQQGQHLRFEVNRRVAAAAKLIISSQLLRLSQVSAGDVDDE